MFKAVPDEAGVVSLKIERVTGAASSKNGPTTYSKSFVQHKAQPVRYSTDYPAVDFFRSLGRIRQADMNNFWYVSDDGKFSVCRDAIFSDENVWRDEYWKTFVASTLYKTPEWTHEEEYRLVVHSLFDMSTKEQRKLKYRFEDLTGIIFGIRTATEAKLKIMKIIERKCIREGRRDFKFFEVRYTPDKLFKVHELSLLKIEAS